MTTPTTTANILSVHHLPNHWREQAASLRKYGATPVAEALEAAVVDLETALTHQADEVYTLTEAARLCGYSADHLGRLVKDGTIPNAGRSGAPRIRRADLPRRPSRVAASPKPEYDAHADAQSLAGRRKETL